MTRKLKRAERLTIEPLEDRCLLTVATVPTDWFTKHLHDAALSRLVVADYQRDGSLTRSDVIGLFQEVASDGFVRFRELRDLRTIMTNGAALGMTPDVVDLGDKVVGYDRANTRFEGRALLANGRLHAGARGVILEDLVDKWFLGQDHPALTQDAISAGCSYKTVKGVLFGPNGPTIQDIDQGILGDCFFPAALGAITAHDPAAIRALFIDNGDGTYAVRFYRKIRGREQAEWVTVDRLLPVDSNGNLVYAGDGQSASNTNEVLWLALAEKAYAQLSASGWNDASKLINSYAALDQGGFTTDVFQQVLGENATNTNLGGESPFLLAVERGDFVTLDSKLQEAKNSPVLENHAYFVTGYSSMTNTYTVINPWGPNFNDGAGHPGTLQLTWTQIRQAFSSWDDAAAIGLVG
jgi:hypothetical protein